MGIKLGNTDITGIKIGNQEVTKVFVGSEQVRPSYTPGPWYPGADTVLYYDFEHTSGTAETDLAGNYNGIYQATPTIGTLSSGKKYFDTQGTNCLNTNNTLSTLDYDNATVCIWFNMQATNQAFFGQERWGAPGGTIFCENYMGNNQFCLGTETNNIYTPLSMGAWHNIVIVNDGVNTTLYRDGQQMTQKSLTSSTGNNKYFHVGGVSAHSTPPSQTLSGNFIGNALFGSVIIENKSRTAQEISDYYDQTKANYGL